MPENEQDNRSETRKAQEIQEEKDKQERVSAGVRGELWTVTTHYDARDHYDLEPEYRKLVAGNLYTREMKSYRENVFAIGLMVPYAPGVFRVISPSRIVNIFIRQQKNYEDD